MQYRYFGNTGGRISQLCFAKISVCAAADQETSAALFRRCREAGISFFHRSSARTGEWDE